MVSETFNCVEYLLGFVDFFCSDISSFCQHSSIHFFLLVKEDLPWRDNWRGPPYHMIIHALQTRYSIWKRVYLKVVFKFFKCGIYYIIMKKSIFYDIKKYVCIANIFASPKNVFVWRYSAYFSPRLMYTITYSEYMYAVFVHQTVQESKWSTPSAKHV